jgi:hypothetical protein
LAADELEAPELPHAVPASASATRQTPSRYRERSVVTAGPPDVRGRRPGREPDRR